MDAALRGDKATAMERFEAVESLARGTGATHRLPAAAAADGAAARQ